MKLGFDIDGITCDMAGAMVDLINKEYDLDHDVTVFKSHNIHKNIYTDDPELNDEIAMTMRIKVIENLKTTANLPVHKEAVLALKKLSRHGHSIHHITARPNKQKKSTTDWLRKNNIPFDTLHVIGTDGKEGAELKTGKGRLGRSLNLDFYLDDCVWHLTDMFRYKNRWRKGLGLYTRPWNADETIDYNMTRFDNWNEIMRHLGIQKR